MFEIWYFIARIETVSVEEARARGKARSSRGEARPARPGRFRRRGVSPWRPRSEGPMRIAFVMDDLSVHSNGTSVTAARYALDWARRWPV